MGSAQTKEDNQYTEVETSTNLNSSNSQTTTIHFNSPNNKPKLCKVEFTYSDGKKKWLEGLDAIKWENMVNGWAQNDFVHGGEDRESPPLDWKETAGPPPRIPFDPTSPISVAKRIEEQIMRNNSCDPGFYIDNLSIGDYTLSEENIGKYFCDQNAFNQQVLECYLNTFNFGGKPISTALQMFVTGFWLPNYGRQVEHVINVFANKYHKDNLGRVRWCSDSDYIRNCSGGGRIRTSTPYKFTNSDIVYLLCHSIIMLSTDKEMTLAQFIHNMKGVNDGADLDSSYLEQTYKRVRNEPLRLRKTDPDPTANLSLEELVDRIERNRDIGKLN
jgi:hypothetical protein